MEEMRGPGGERAEWFSRRALTTCALLLSAVRSRALFHAGLLPLAHPTGRADLNANPMEGWQSFAPFYINCLSEVGIRHL